MVIRKNADETEFEIVLEGQKSLEEIEYDIQESPYSLFTDHPIMIDPARNIHYLVPPKDPVWPKQLWAKLNRMIEDSRPITEEDYALYRRRIEWCEWVSNCPFIFNCEQMIPTIRTVLPVQFWECLAHIHNPSHVNTNVYYIKHSQWIYFYIF